MKLKLFFLFLTINIINLFSEDKYKDIFPIQFIPDSIINLERNNELFNGYMVIEISKNNSSNTFNKEFFYSNCYFLFNLDDLNNSDKHIYYNIAWLYYASAALSSNYEYSNDTSLKYLNFKLFYNDYIKNAEENNPFLYKLLSTKIFKDTNFILYQYDDFENYCYYIVNCSFNCSILSYSCHPKITNDCDIDYLSLFYKKRQFIIPTTKCTQFIPLDAIQAKNYGLIQTTWFPENIIYSK